MTARPGPELLCPPFRRTNRGSSERDGREPWRRCAGPGMSLELRRGELMTVVAVVVHAGKTFGGGLKELREVLAEAGYRTPLWYEVHGSRRAPKAMHSAVHEGAELIFVWGGDGMVQRCVDALNGSEVPIAILPAGTGNLLATYLGVPKDVTRAVEIGLNGARRKLDLGVMNGERFAAMAGTGFDALMVYDTDRTQKEKRGRAC